MFYKIERDWGEIGWDIRKEVNKLCFVTGIGENNLCFVTGNRKNNLNFVTRNGKNNLNFVTKAKPMQEKIMYIEQVNPNHNGPAWIGKVQFSKSGKSVYFNGKAFKKAPYGGGYYDLETGDEYWISGVKKNGQDRHWAGSGKIFVEKSVAETYLEMVGFDVLDKNRFEWVEVLQTDKEKFMLMENGKLEE